MVALGLGELIAYNNREVTAGVILSVCLWCIINYISDKNFVCAGRCIIGILCIAVGFIIMADKSLEYDEAEERFSFDLHCIRGTVCDIGNTSSGYVLTIKQTQGNGNVLIYVKDKDDIKIGNVIKAEVEYMPYEGSRNEGCFDDRLYYRSIGISGRFYGDDIAIKDNKVFVLKQGMYDIKRKAGKLSRLLYSEEKAALYDAMLLGEKSGIDEDVKELYKGAGIYHLCCISGTHMALLGLGIYKILRKKFKFTVSGALGISGIIIYGIFTGMMISVVRAVIMLSVRIMADILGRSYDMLSSMSLAAIFIIISNPYALLNSGVMLSFGAVTAICTIIPAAERIYSVKSRFIKSLFLSLGIQLITLPVMAYFFFEIPVYGILINVIVIPCIVYIILSGMGGILAAVFNISIGKFIAGIGNYGLELYDTLCRIVLRLPYSEYVTGRPDIWRIIIYYAVLMTVIFAAWKLCDKETEFSEEYWYVRYGKIVGGISLVIIACVILFTGRDNDLSVKFIYVGQGDSTFIRINRKTEYLIDAGSSDVDDVGKYRIIPVLKSNGVGQLDYLIVTHTDNDHINGIDQLLKERTGSKPFVKTLVLPDVSEKDDDYLRLENNAVENNVAIRYISAGIGWKGKNYRFECLYPYKGMSDSDKNDMSVVMRLSAYNKNMMFMGDLGSKGEKNLISSGMLKKCSILKAGHHGSKNSTSKEFLEITRPFISIISCGKDNSYGHPAKETLDRLSGADSIIYRTDMNGEIMADIGEKFIKVDYYNK